MPGLVLGAPVPGGLPILLGPLIPLGLAVLMFPKKGGRGQKRAFLLTKRSLSGREKKKYY